jgi:uncharacterized membrane protein YebE (DUF533 family)
MANLGRMLGMLLATRMAGRGRFGSALGTAALMRGGLASKAGLAGLGYMAYRAYRDGKASRPDAAQQPGPGRRDPATADPATTDPAQHATGQRGQPMTGGIAGALGGIVDSLTGGQMASRKGEPGLGDRIRSYFDPASVEPARPAEDGRAAEPAPPPEAAEIDDGRALLLIRGMIAAANADGQITPEERRRIVARLDEGGADAEDHRLIEQELDNPRPLDTLLAQVHDHDTAQQFYAASRAAMDGESPTQTSYLDYLRNRLGLPPEETAEIDQAMQ